MFMDLILTSARQPTSGVFPVPYTDHYITLVYVNL